MPTGHAISAVVELVEAEYVVVRLPSHEDAVAVAMRSDFNSQGSPAHVTVGATVSVTPVYTPPAPGKKASSKCVFRLSSFLVSHES